MSTKRRVSYVIPPPDHVPPRLQLPSFGASRLGSAGPLLIPADGDSPGEFHRPRHPRHRLGITALALDCSTELTGHSAPEGILYSAGRDGLVLSWDLQLPMKKRKPKEEERPGKWEKITGWADSIDEDEDEGPISVPGDILGTVVGTRRKRPTKLGEQTLPYENQWEIDVDAVQPGQPSSFRQCAQLHTDWINDIVLCNYNQTVVSGSSDGTLKTWNPHSQTSDPSVIGAHSDYVRCLSYCREQNWVASGSLDRSIKLWDLAQSSNNQEPLVTLHPADASAAKSSVYALATDPFGHTIASGSPERVVRLWDPRSGKRTGKLVGHTDNIRAILISEDSRYLLTGSADASIKLWSLASQRCLHTFTHHTDSVWSLFSSHPQLEIFLSGDRSGIVCRTDVENCTDVSEGECIVMCQDTPESAVADGINKIVALDDNLLWTATGSSMIRRWRVPPRRALRATLEYEVDKPSVADSPPSSLKYEHGEDSSRSEVDLPNREKTDKSTLFGIPFDSLVRLTSPNSPFGFYTSSKDRDPEIATLYSAASVMSVPKTNLRSPMQSTFAQSYHHKQNHRPEDTETPSAQALYEEREIAADAAPLYRTPDAVIHGDHGLVRSIILNDRIHALSVDTSGEVAVWDIVRCICKGRFTKEDVAVASMRAPSSNSSGGAERVSERDRSPREALEIVRERIEREAVVLPWSTADTKSGVLTIHVTERCFDAEVYADEVGFVHDRFVNDESKLNIGKWVLRNLFLGFIREQQRLQRKRDRSNSRDENHNRDNPHESPKRSSRSSVVSSSKMIPAVAPTVSASIRSSPLLTPLIPLNVPKETALPLPAIPQSPVISDDVDATPLPRRFRSGTLDSQQASAAKDGDYFSVPTRRPSVTASTPDEFSGWPGPGKSEAGLQTPMTPSGGLMGRLKNFGKNKKAATDTISTPSLGTDTTLVESTTALEDSAVSEVKTPLQELLSQPLSPPPSNEAPLHNLPPHITLMISEETHPSFTTLYRGTVNSAGHDTPVLEEVMPIWLLEYLLHNKLASAPPLVKISFILLPWPTKDPDGTQLPELLNTQQSKLTASRWLRVRKLVNHVQDKLDKFAASTASLATSSARTSIDSQHHPPARPPAEDLYEILCNDTLLPLDMSLAAVRHYIWRQPSELTLYYRLKQSHAST
ncbi:WD40 repeat-like protein [Gymnopus androsaceus JB14]|uniref:WD40 repeat-like protein n=1 Tax=Gymnopus androsaceus JB14 TaxID=1447944 RepID=A0A6A4IQ76_9AGAR|nr:WD40 repeat-like protein [Gymnopus androsaceus JB14]